MPKIATLPLEKKAKKFNNNVYPQNFNGRNHSKIHSNGSNPSNPILKGKAAVKWMLSSDIGVSNEVEAIILGELLLNANVIVPLKRDPLFNCTAKDFYAFTVF